MDPRDRRRSERIVKVVPVLLGLVEPKQEGITRVINRQGALLIAPESWAADTRLAMLNPATKQSVVCRVVWNGGSSEPGQWVLGIEFLQERPDFWGSAYSPGAGVAAS